MIELPKMPGFSFGPVCLEFSMDERRKAEDVLAAASTAGPAEFINQGQDRFKIHRHYASSSLDAKWDVAWSALELTAWIIKHDPFGEQVLQHVAEPLRDQFIGARPCRIAVYVIVSDSAATRRNYFQAVEQLLHLGVSRADCAELRRRGYTLGKLAADYRLRKNGGGESTSQKTEAAEVEVEFPVECADAITTRLDGDGLTLLADPQLDETATGLSESKSSDPLKAAASEGKSEEDPPHEISIATAELQRIADAREVGEPASAVDDIEKLRPASSVPATTEFEFKVNPQNPKAATTQTTPDPGASEEATDNSLQEFASNFDGSRPLVLRMAKALRGSTPLKVGGRYRVEFIAKSDFDGIATSLSAIGNAKRITTVAIGRGSK